MSLSVGIVGLPNVGKSTLFNALLRKQAAFSANFPFATIDPNVGVVPVPDKRLIQLAEVVKNANSMDGLPPQVPATVEFVDIAGLIAGAHKGEGLGNKFLHHIREVDAICHVVRVFENEDIIRHESAKDINPKRDLEIIETELALADLSTIENQKQPKGKVEREDTDRWNAVQKIRVLLEQVSPARDADLTEEEMKQAKQLSLLTMKPIMIVINVSESDLGMADELEKKYAQEFAVSNDQVIAICASVEEELVSLTKEESDEYLKELGMQTAGLERLIKKAFLTLGLITFLTAGEKEVRAWTIKKGFSAPKSAGVIHTDFEKKFIKADVVNFDDFVGLEGWKGARENGKVRQEGKEYIVQEGDIIEFKTGS